MNFELALINVATLCMLTTPHEFAHAWVATKLGDDTPELEGRVTLYPPAHIDLLGTVIFPFVTSLLAGGFIGWGKPVNTNPAKLRFGWNGLLLVALAGPASNLIFAVVLVAASVFSARFFIDFSQFCGTAASLSVYLAIFNLLPVPPLDGSKILIALRFPPVIYRELAQFGFILLIVAFQITPLGRWMGMASDTVILAILSVFR